MAATIHELCAQVAGVLLERGVLKERMQAKAFTGDIRALRVAQADYAILGLRLGRMRRAALSIFAKRFGWKVSGTPISPTQLSGRRRNRSMLDKMRDQLRGVTGLNTGHFLDHSALADHTEFLRTDRTNGASAVIVHGCGLGPYDWPISHRCHKLGLIPYYITYPSWFRPRGCTMTLLVPNDLFSRAALPEPWALDREVMEAIRHAGAHTRIRILRDLSRRGYILV